MKCPRSVNDGKDRCSWEGELEDFAQHAAETGHWPCAVCGYPLRDEEVRTCGRCMSRAHEDLDTIEEAFARLGPLAESSGYHQGSLPGGDALVLIAGGSLEGGGPDDHIRFNDPIPVLVQLHFWQRDWEETFGHTYQPKWQATIDTVLAYLREWLWLAGRTHDAFPDYMSEIRTLAFRCSLIAGMIDMPVPAPIPCACGGELLQQYGDKGLSDNRECRSCGTVYPPADYLWRYRMLTEMEGWVSVDRAAEAIDRPVATVWAWAQKVDIPSACHRLTKRVVVELEAVLARDAATPRRQRRAS